MEALGVAGKAAAWTLPWEGCLMTIYSLSSQDEDEDVVGLSEEAEALAAA